MTLAAICKFFGAKNSAKVGKRPGARLRVEHLEARWVPATLTVGTQLYPTIQSALTAANNGDTVNVPGGTYTLSGSSGLQISKNNVKLIGTGSGSNPTVLKADSTFGNDAMIDILGTNDKVSGFTLNGGGNATKTIDSAVRINAGASGTVTGDAILGLYNAAISTTPGVNDGYGYGVHVANGGTAKVQYNTISGYFKAGVLVDGTSTNATVTSNTITGQGATAANTQYGVLVSNNASARVESNTISQNVYTLYGGTGVTSAGVGVLNTGASTHSVVVDLNTLSGNQNGVAVQGGSDGKHQIKNVSVVNNTIANTNADGIIFLNVDNSEIENNSLSNNGFNKPTGTGPGGGITLFDSNSNEIDNNCIDKSTLDGVYVGQSTGTSNNNDVSENNVTNSGGNGVYLFGATNTTLWNNYTTTSTLSGIRIELGSGNQVWLSSSSYNTLDGITLVGTSNTFIAFNALDYNGRFGVNVTAGSTNTGIYFNAMIGNQGGINVDSTSSGVSSVGNIVVNRTANTAATGSGQHTSATDSIFAGCESLCSQLDD